MSYQECIHYDEILKVLSESGNLEDVSFEIDDIKNCKECSEIKGVCKLWINLGFVESMKPQMGLDDARVTIETLDLQMKRIVFTMLKDASKNNED